MKQQRLGMGHQTKGVWKQLKWMRGKENTF